MPSSFSWSEDRRHVKQPRRFGPISALLFRRGEGRVDEGLTQDRFGSRAATPIGATTGTERRFKHGPLGVGQVRAVESDGDPTDVSGRDQYL